MTKTQIIEAVAQNTGESVTHITRITNELFDEIQVCLNNHEEVNIPGFGKFYTKKRAARKAKNLHTGEMMDIPEKMAPAFQPSKALKESVNKES